MKKIIIIALSIFLFQTTFSQTREKKVKYLDQEYKSGRLSLDEYKVGKAMK